MRGSNCLSPCHVAVVMSLAVAMMFHVNSSWTHSVFGSVEEIKVFQACAAVNVKTGGMF